MMTFLHKYQRAATVIISICMISTFVFFGTSRAFIPKNEMAETVVVKKGKMSITLQKMQMRSFFLSSEISEATNPRHLFCSLINLGFLSEYIFETGLAEQILTLDPQSIQELELKWAKEAKWSGYQHPKLGYLNFSSLLSQINPSCQRALKQYQSKKPESIAKEKIALWREIHKTPFQAIRSLVRYQESGSGLAQDTSLSPKNIQPFGYQSLDEWFGPRFIALCVQVIELGARKAENLGYNVSWSMAQKFLEARLQELFTAFQAHDKNINYASFERQLFQNIGFEKSDLISLWQDLLLFERLAHHEGSRVFIDPLICQAMAKFASEEVKTVCYEMADVYRISNLKDMASIQLYWHLVSGLKLDDTSIPQKTLSVNEISRVAPELISKSAKLAVRTLTLDEIRQAMGLKQLLLLQAREDMWPKVLELSSDLKAVAKGVVKPTMEQKLDWLSNLKAKDREILDRTAIALLAEKEPEPLRELLSAQEVKEEVLKFPLASVRQPLKGIANAREMFEALGRQTLLIPYTQDRIHYYSLELRSEPTDEIISYGVAKNGGILEALLTRRLQSHYESMKATSPAVLTKDGKVLGFKASQDKVIISLFQNLLAKLAHFRSKVCLEANLKPLDTPEIATDLATWRYSPFFQESIEKLQQNEEPFMDLDWSLRKTERSFTREKTIHTPLESIFNAKDGVWLSTSFEGKPLDRIIQRISATQSEGNPYSLADRAHMNFASKIDQAALAEWLNSLELDVELKYLQKQ